MLNRHNPKTTSKKRLAKTKVSAPKKNFLKNAEQTQAFIRTIIIAIINNASIFSPFIYVDFGAYLCVLKYTA